MKLKLSPEESDVLEYIISGRSWTVLLKIIDHLASAQEQDVVKYNLNSGTQGLIERKARAEGARKLERDFQNLDPTNRKLVARLAT